MKIIRPVNYVETENIEFIVKDDLDLKNGAKVILIINSNPSIEQIKPVVLHFNDVICPVQDILGNNLMSDQLRMLPKSTSGLIVRLIYGSNPKHFKVLVQLKDSAFITNS